MSPSEVALLFLACALSLLTGRGLVPGLLIVLRPGLLGTWFLNSELEARHFGVSPALDDCLERLKAQRFVLLGVKCEKLPLWGPLYREVSMVARDQSAYASIVLGELGVPRSVYLYTPLAGGDMVFTRDYAGGRQVEGERLSVRNVPTEDPEMLVRDHAARVKAMCERGALPQVRPSQAGRLEATRVFYASDYFRRAGMLQLLPSLLSFALSIALLTWAILAPLLS